MRSLPSRARKGAPKKPGDHQDPHQQTKRRCDQARKISTIHGTQYQVGCAVPHSPDQREKKNNQVSQSYSLVDTQSRQHECSQPQHVERHEARVSPMDAEKFRELMLKASYIFFGEMQALDCDREQIDGQNRGSIVFPGSYDPYRIRNHQSATQKNDGRAHPVSLRSQHDQYQQSANYAVTRRHFSSFSGRTEPRSRAPSRKTCLP